MNEITLDNYTYYFRLTLVHPKDVNKLDPTLGKILCETAATGKFIMTDVSWEGTVSPNSVTSVAYNTTGELKIYEPLGLRFLDYIRFAAIEVGLLNHFDARYLLEMEILSEELGNDAKFRYCWPIMFMATEVKNSVSEKGSEYNIQFVHTGGHSQTDIVQSLKSGIQVDGVSEVGQYFKEFGKKLELLEFDYAASGEKAGSDKKPGGEHPAETDNYHDEYHFILDPRIERYTLTTGNTADKAVQGAWFNFLRSVDKYNISAKGGTTIIAQIQRVLSSTQQASDLYLENYGSLPAASSASSSSSDANRKSLQKVLGKIYNFFRVETYTTYKEYDYIRGRYACRHIFIIYLALEPTLYQYPDELDELNRPENKNKVITKLKAYIQEDLLTKSYYYQYTGLNTEILKFNIQLNQGFYLPSFPVVWADRGETGPGQMSPHNFSRQLSPFARSGTTVDSQKNLQNLRDAAVSANAAFRNEKNNKKKEALKKEWENKKRLLEDAERQMSATGVTSTVNANVAGNRSEYLESLKNLYAEDIDYNSSWEVASHLTPAHRPRIETSNPPAAIDKKKSENEATMEKIWSVQLAARDLMEIEMDIRGDPFWLGKQNIILSGKQNIEKLKLHPKITERITEYMNAHPKLDSDWATRDDSAWGNYTSANFYKGSNLFYLNSQLPVNEMDEDDLLKFNGIDQIIGIYKVVKIKNEFKEGRWVQSINAIRDLTIPSQHLPKASIGAQGWEAFMASAKAEGHSAYEEIRQAITERKALEENAQNDVRRGNAQRQSAPLFGGVNVKEKEMAAYLTELGFDKNSTAGIIANAFAESSYRPYAYISSDAGKGQGGGLFGFHDPKNGKGEFTNMVNATGGGDKWKTDWKGQIDYAAKASKMPKTGFSSPEAASEHFVRKYERPANIEKEVIKRNNYAKAIASRI